MKKCVRLVIGKNLQRDGGEIAVAAKCSAALKLIIVLFNPLNTELNPICHLLALLGCATIVVVSRLRVKIR